MKITIVAVGTLKEIFWREAAKEYLKRLAGYAHVAIIEIPECRVGQDANAGDEARARAAEAQAIAKAVPQGSVPILLAINGEQRSSEQWAGFFCRRATRVTLTSHLYNWRLDRRRRQREIFVSPPVLPRPAYSSPPTRAHRPARANLPRVSHIAE